MIDIRNIKGRWPELRIPLKPEDMLVYTREGEDGVTVVRLDSKTDDTFWMEFEIVTQPIEAI